MENSLGVSLLSDLTRGGMTPPPTFDEDGTCILNFFEDLPCILENEDESIICTFVLGELPKENIDAVLYELMSLNFYWIETRGGTIAIDQEFDQIVLSYKITDKLIGWDNFCDFFKETSALANYFRNILTQEK